MEVKIKKLRTEHTALSNEVKGINSNDFPGSEFVTALQHISADHELMKKRYAEECEHLKQKYLKECAERKRLYNEIIELKGNIRVFCRCRPLNKDEIANGCTSVVEFDSSHENKLQITCADYSEKQFSFDHVFGPEDSQDAVFSETSSVVTSVLDGYNVCILAYGQTGTGKTFTMEGTSENRGVNYRTLEELFRLSNERSSKMKYELYVSMLEVYNEKLRDLLSENSAQKLEIKQGPEGTQEVPGLVEARVYSTDEVWKLLKRGNQASLLRVTVKGEELVSKMRTKSNLWLVDLAGSERVGKTEAEGERLKESQFINKSLSALGDVISALASKAAHIPYRNSKLTHILQSSLGGDCKTLMFVQISPSSSDLGETMCSLNFAGRARGIEYGSAHKHVDLSELLKYKQMSVKQAEKLKHEEKEMKKLQDTVQSLQLRLSSREYASRNLQDKVKDLENQLAHERKLRFEEGKPVSSSIPPPKNFTKPPRSSSFKLRQPLRQMNNNTSLPQPTKTATHFSRPLNSTADKENKSAGTTNSSKPLLQPRRFTVDQIMSSQIPNGQTMLPRMQETNSYMRTPLPTATKRHSFFGFAATPSSAGTTISSKPLLQPRRFTIGQTMSSQIPNGQTMPPRTQETNSYMRTPLTTATKRHSIFKDGVGVVAATPLQPRRFTTDQTMLPRMQETNSYLRTPLTTAAKRHSFFGVAATPSSVNSSRFIATPLTQVGSWKPKHPTVIALQKKYVLWSPLRSSKGLKNLKNQR